MLPFGLSNFVGALVLGRLFDTIGRRAMISMTYMVAAAGFAATAFLFGRTRTRLGSRIRRASLHCILFRLPGGIGRLSHSERDLSP